MLRKVGGVASHLWSPPPRQGPSWSICLGNMATCVLCLRGRVRLAAKLRPGQMEAARYCYCLGRGTPMRNEVCQGTTTQQGCISMCASAKQNNAIILQA